MAEPLSELLRLRITPSQRQHLSEAAALAGLSSSEYARQLLTLLQSVQSELVSLHHTLEIQLDQQSPTTQMETLMLSGQVQVVGVQGLAGTGKSFALQQTKVLLEAR